MPSAFIISLIIGLIVAGTISGFVTGMMIQQANPSVQRGQLLLIVVGWFVAWIIGGATSWAVNRNVVSPIGWAVSGAIGNSVMLWQLGRTGTI